eukprot:444074-Rhodomonas_salina.1
MAMPTLTRCAERLPTACHSGCPGITWPPSALSVEPRVFPTISLPVEVCLDRLCPKTYSVEAAFRMWRLGLECGPLRSLRPGTCWPGNVCLGWLRCPRLSCACAHFPRPCLRAVSDRCVLSLVGVLALFPRSLLHEERGQGKKGEGREERATAQGKRGREGGRERGRIGGRG